MSKKRHLALIILLLMCSVGTSIRIDDDQSEYDDNGGDQTYLVISQPDAAKPFMIRDNVPNSTVMYMINYESEDEFSIKVPGIASFYFSRHGQGVRERIDVFCNNRLRYRCQYYDQTQREALVMLILSSKSFGIAQSPQAYCERYYD